MEQTIQFVTLQETTKFEDRAIGIGNGLTGWSIFWYSLLTRNLRKENKA